MVAPLASLIQMENVILGAKGGEELHADEPLHVPPTCSALAASPATTTMVAPLSDLDAMGDVMLQHLFFNVVLIVSWCFMKTF